MARGMKKQFDLAFRTRRRSLTAVLSDRVALVRWRALALALILVPFLAVDPAFGQADPNAPLVKDLLGASGSLGLEWAKLFDDNGRAKDEVDAAGSLGANGIPDYIDWYGGFDGTALEERISAGLAVDMSVLAGGPAISSCSIYNGTVNSASDLGNSYVYATLDSYGNPVLYIGIESLEDGADTFVEVEFNQAVVRVTNGDPWPVRGERTANDLLVRVNSSLGVVSSVEVESWVIDQQEVGSFQPVATYGGLETSACNGTPGYTLFCSGSPPIAAVQQGWDLAGNAVPAESLAPNGFVELGVSVGNLFGGFIEYTSVQVRTPEDIALGAFSAMGHWAGN